MPQAAWSTVAGQQSTDYRQQGLVYCRTVLIYSRDAIFSVSVFFISEIEALKDRHKIDKGCKQRYNTLTVCQKNCNTS